MIRIGSSPEGDLHILRVIGRLDIRAGYGIRRGTKVAERCIAAVCTEFNLDLGSTAALRNSMSDLDGTRLDGIESCNQNVAGGSGNRIVAGSIGIDRRISRLVGIAVNLDEPACELIVFAVYCLKGVVILFSGGINLGERLALILILRISEVCFCTCSHAGYVVDVIGIVGIINIGTGRRLILNLDVRLDIVGAGGIVPAAVGTERVVGTLLISFVCDQSRLALRGICAVKNIVQILVITDRLVTISLVDRGCETSIIIQQ